MFPTNPDKLNHFAPDKSNIIAKNNECVGAWQIFIVQLRYNEKLRAKNYLRYIIDVRWKRKSVIKYSTYIHSYNVRRNFLQTCPAHYNKHSVLFITI